MSISALHAAASGMKAMDTQLSVIANNLANANTVGFKSSRVNFEDLFYEERRQPGSLNSLGQRTSTGLFVGLGVQESNSQLNLKTGDLEPTGRELDVAITGPGFFKVQSFDSIGGGTAYTRAGNFVKNNEGVLVLGTVDGPVLDPPLTIPNGATTVNIASDGRVSAVVDGEEQDIGQIELYKFANPQGLRLEGGNLFTATEASGAEIAGNPADPGFGLLTQNFLEGSNVDTVTELINMIRTQRTFELNSQAIKAADETLQVVNRLK